jgi:hypothetical protein
MDQKLTKKGPKRDPDGTKGAKGDTKDERGSHTASGGSNTHRNLV